MEPGVPYLDTLMNQSLQLEACPAHFRNSTMVVLRKQSKDNYATRKSYHPIVLLNTIGKVMDAIIARRLGYLVKNYRTIPRLLIGGRKLRLTEHGRGKDVRRKEHRWSKPAAQPSAALRHVDQQRPPGAVRTCRRVPLNQLTTEDSTQAPAVLDHTPTQSGGAARLSSREKIVPFMAPPW